jgi:hypothetical protein
VDYVRSERVNLNAIVARRHTYIVSWCMYLILGVDINTGWVHGLRICVVSLYASSLWSMSGKYMKRVIVGMCWYAVVYVVFVRGIHVQWSNTVTCAVDTLFFLVLWDRCSGVPRTSCHTYCERLVKLDVESYRWFDMVSSCAVVETSLPVTLLRCSARVYLMRLDYL